MYVNLLALNAAMSSSSILSPSGIFVEDNDGVGRGASGDDEAPMFERSGWVVGCIVDKFDAAIPPLPNGDAVACPKPFDDVDNGVLVPVPNADPVVGNALVEVAFAPPNADANGDAVPCI